MKRFWIIVLIAGFAFVALSAFQYLMRPGSGDLAPGFELPTLDGDSMSFYKFDGKPRLVHFWATWCNYCRVEFPSMSNLYDLYHDKGLMIFAISEDGDGGDDSVRYFLKENKVNFPILLDRDGAVADEYMSFGMPESILVDRDGIIIKRFTGAVNWDTHKVRDLIEKMIEKGEMSDVKDDKSP